MKINAYQSIFLLINLSSLAKHMFSFAKLSNRLFFFKFLSRTTGMKEVDGYPDKLPRLIYIPGTICSKGPEAQYQLRLSYGFEEGATFEKVFQLIREACLFALSI